MPTMPLLQVFANLRLLRVSCLALVCSAVAPAAQANPNKSPLRRPAAPAQITPVPASVILELATHFDAERYMGLWYKAGKVENAQAELTTRERYELMLRYDGAIRVIYTYYQPLSNQWKRIEDYMSPIDRTGATLTPSQKADIPVTFRVSRFGNLFSVDYRTLAIDAHYQWALVKGPRADSFFILSRTPTVDESLRNALTQLAKRSFPSVGTIRWSEAEIYE